MDFVQHDGGRSRYYGKHRAGDCVIRAIAIATDQDYKTVFEDLTDLAKSKGLFANCNRVWRKYLRDRGWVEHKHGRDAKDLFDYDMKGRNIAHTRNHLSAVIDNVNYDTWDNRYLTCWRVWTKT